MNGAVKAYLDANFRTSSDLKDKLDTESTRLRTNEEEIQRKIQIERESAEQARADALKSLRSYFERLSNGDMFNGVPSDRDLNECLGSFGTDSEIRKHALAGFKNLQTWAKGYQVMQKLVVLCETSIQLANNLSDNNEKGAIDLFTSNLESERVLKVFSKSSTPLIASLAQKGMEEFDCKFRTVLQDRFRNQLREFLKEVDWPKVKSIPKSKHDRFSEILTKLLITQSTSMIDNYSPKTPEPLEAFRLLVEPLDLRFQFHFEGDRDTNRSDKPEWVFSHFISVVDEHYDTLSTSVQTALNSTDRFKDRNAVHEFIVALLKPIYRKLDSLFPEISNSPKLLSHLVYETVTFDNQLKEMYFFVPYGNDQWRGVSGDMLARSDWFEKWLQVERESSVARYKEIIESDTAFTLDWEVVGPNETKPTHSAINLKDLLEGITEHYSSLRSVNYRMRFLLDIQIDIIEKYYEKLRDSIDAFDSMSSSLVRAVGGMSAESAKMVTGINGLERLCRIYGSLDYIASTLETWGQELFFLELWDDICSLSAKKKSLDRKVAQAVDSSSATIPENEDDEGTLFDETVASYNKLKNRVTLTISSVLKKELQHSMDDYFKTSYWKTDSSPNSGEISSKLVQPIKVLSKELSFLRSFHTPNDFTLITRAFAADLSRYIWNYIIQSNQFSQYGAQQLSNDITELWASLLLPRDGSLRKVEQAVIILGLPREEKDQKSQQQLKDELRLSDLSLDDIRGIIKRLY